ncbi:MAG TPA: EamA family transporter [Spirochaetota bacterium]|nr:EamA family transporter [Spirochaetota bacterium]HPR49825.1 EamA family transporter [Spirochaetota bacterium]
MNVLIVPLILFSVLLSSVAQIVLKTGMSDTGVINAINLNPGFPVIRAIATNYWVLGGLFLYFSSALVWLFVLAKVDVSLAYPFVGVGFIFTMLLGYFILGEALTVSKVMGTVLIVIGVIFLTRG